MTALQDQLDEITANTRTLVQAERLAVGERAVAELFQTGIEENILPVGATAPEFALKDSTGKSVVANGESGKPTASGYVYLVKSGKLHKIGCSENHWRRKSELHKQTAEGITEVHTISAIDDASGIERYWHERFKETRQHGEWFDLSPEEISAFKKRKSM